jgi:hypothetical protein
MSFRVPYRCYQLGYRPSQDVSDHNGKWTTWPTYIGRSDGTSSGWSSNLVRKDLIADSLQITVGEDEANVALDVGKEALILWRIGEETLDGTTNLLKQFINGLDLMIYFMLVSFVPWYSFPSTRRPLRGERGGSRASAGS